MHLPQSALLATLLLPAIPAAADVTYTYTGDLFTWASTNTPGSGYTTSDRITGSITLASSIPSNSANDQSPLSFSFTDGVQTFTNTTPNLDVFALALWTGSNGLPDFWWIELLLPNGTPNEPDEIYSLDPPCACPPANPTDDGFLYVLGGLDTGAGNTSEPGTWTISDSPAATTPEPSTWLLAATGLASAAAIRKHPRRSQPKAGQLSAVAK